MAAATTAIMYPVLEGMRAREERLRVVSPELRTLERAVLGKIDPAELLAKRFPEGSGLKLAAYHCDRKLTHTSMLTGLCPSTQACCT